MVFDFKSFSCCFFTVLFILEGALPSCPFLLYFFFVNINKGCFLLKI